MAGGGRPSKPGKRPRRKAPAPPKVPKEERAVRHARPGGGNRGNPRTVRNEAEKAAHLERIAELRVRRRSIREISIEVGLSFETVRKDVLFLEKEWRQKANDHISRHRARLLATTEALVRDAFEGWIESRKPAVVQRIVRRPVTDEKGRQLRGPDGPLFVEEITQEQRGQAGDPQFLRTILEAIREQSRLLGVAKTPPPPGAGEDEELDTNEGLAAAVMRILGTVRRPPTIAATARQTAGDKIPSAPKDPPKGDPPT